MLLQSRSKPAHACELCNLSRCRPFSTNIQAFWSELQQASFLAPSTLWGLKQPISNTQKAKDKYMINYNLPTTTTLSIIFSRPPNAPTLSLSLIGRYVLMRILSLPPSSFASTSSGQCVRILYLLEFFSQSSFHSLGIRTNLCASRLFLQVQFYCPLAEVQLKPK